MVGYSEVCVAKKVGNHIFAVGKKLTIRHHFIMIMPILTDMEISFFIFQANSG